MRCVVPCRRDGVEPISQLLVQVLEIAEAAGQEEVLADIAEWSLDFALGFGAIRPAGSGLEAKVLGQRQQRAIVDDVAFVIFAGDRRLHPVVEDLDRYSSNGVERLHMTAQQRLQVLVHDVAGEDVARVAKHEREQPDDARHARRVGELGDEAREVDLCLISGRSLEPHLEGTHLLLRSDCGHEALRGGVGAVIAALTNLARQAHGAQIGKGRDPFAQIVDKGHDLVWPPRLSRAIGGKFEPALDVFADRLGIAARSPSNRGHGQALTV